MGFRLFVIWLGTLCLPPMVGGGFYRSRFAS